ncbi:MAG: iron-sulfur cluster assembly accessory protein [Gammaproteobacteria bacterium]|nr:MAG: iron-sulfur cluster assembly accessory protein [Gammaproteobacteria bacterium]
MSIEVTETAANQIKKAAVESKLENTSLRIAATRNSDDSLHYGLGFDDIGSNSEKDHSFKSNGVEIVVADSSFELLNGTTLDYIELEPKQFHFVFLNPNDPNYTPPTES